MSTSLLGFAKIGAKDRLDYRANTFLAAIVIQEMLPN